MRASLVNKVSAVALVASAAISITAIDNSAQAVTVLFDFNSLSDTSASLNSGTTSQKAANRISANDAIETYLKNVLAAAGYANAVDMPYVAGSMGANAEKDYAGEGYVVGLTGLSSSTKLYSNGVVPLTLGNTDYYGRHDACTTAANCSVNTTTKVFTPTLGVSDPAHPSNVHTGTTSSSLDTYITNQQSLTSQFEIDILNSALKVTQISFDFEIFPSTDSTPDLTFKFKGSDGKTYSYKYTGVNPPEPDSSPNSSNEAHNQLIGHLDIDTQLICGPACYATALYFVDWPVTIGIDNLAFGWQPPPPPPPHNNAPEPMTSVLLLSGLGGLWLARRRRFQS